MQEIVGYILIFLGVIMEILAILVWLGILKPASAKSLLAKEASIFDLLLELLKRAPWTAVVGLLLIYAGLKMIGVALPF